MATASEVKAGLDDISTIIRTARQKAQQCKAIYAQQAAILVALPTTYADLISTIDGYTPDNDFEALAKAEKAVLQTEFLALRTKLQTAETDLDAIDFSV
jgi:hypothetical protein